MIPGRYHQGAVGLTSERSGIEHGGLARQETGRQGSEAEDSGGPSATAENAKWTALGREAQPGKAERVFQ